GELKALTLALGDAECPGKWAHSHSYRDPEHIQARNVSDPANPEAGQLPFHDPPGLTRRTHPVGSRGVDLVLADPLNLIDRHRPFLLVMTRSFRCFSSRRKYGLSAETASAVDRNPR